MIRYAVTERDLLAAIDREAPTWRARAQHRTTHLAALGRYEEGGPDWGEIKAVYMRLQHCKCIYCERQLEGSDYGQIEHDVEHFRPKNAVEVWSPPSGAFYPFPLGAEHPAGYYLLAFHPLNYATACKTCNSPLKKNYFPIEGARLHPPTQNPGDYDSERPFLLCPLLKGGLDPQKLLTFEGIMARPRYRSGRRHRIARVIIDFFRLNEREHLLKVRATIIRDIFISHSAATLFSDPDAQQLVRDALDSKVHPSAPHASCALHFKSLCDADLARAGELALAAQGLLESMR